MSREEVVFTKRAIVAVSVISVIGSNIVMGFLAAMWIWRFSDQLKQETISVATEAAVAAVKETIRPMQDAAIKRDAQEEIRQKRTTDDIETLKARQERIEDRFDRSIGR